MRGPIDENEAAFSGHISYKMAKEKGRFNDFYLNRVLGSISKATRPKNRGMTGSYKFKEGEISNIQALEGNGRSKIVSLRFNKITPKFLDRLIDSMITEIRNCSLSCTIKGGVNYERLKISLKEKCIWFGETSHNFSLKIKVRGKPVGITAYPDSNITTFSASWRKRCRILPSNIIHIILTRGGEGA